MRWIPILALGATTACATLQGSDAPDPEARFDAALEALERQDFRAAYEQLSQVYATSWSAPLGERALLAMAAVELDPRNGGRRLDVGADLAARHFQAAEEGAWSTPVSQTLYLLAQELGAAEARTTRAEAERERAEAETQAAREAVQQAEREKAEAEAEQQEARAQARRATAQAREARQRATRAEAQARSASRALPRYSGTSVSARVGELRGERDRLRAEVETLRRRLAERERELERIRATLSPGG